MRRFKNKPVRAAVSCLASGFFLFHFAQGQSIPQPKLLPLPMPIFQEGQDWTVILENEGTLHFRFRKPIFKNNTVYFNIGPRESIQESEMYSGFTVNFYPKTQWAVFAMRQRGAIDGVMCAFKYNAEYFKDKPKTIYGKVVYSDSNAYFFDIGELYEKSNLACRFVMDKDIPEENLNMIDNSMYNRGFKKVSENELTGIKRDNFPHKDDTWKVDVFENNKIKESFEVKVGESPYDQAAAGIFIFSPNPISREITEDLIEYTSIVYGSDDQFLEIRRHFAEGAAVVTTHSDFCRVYGFKNTKSVRQMGIYFDGQESKYGELLNIGDVRNFKKCQLTRIQ